jgi:hypothetical protein
MTLKEQDKVQKYGAGNALILQELPVRTESPDIRYKRHGKRRTGEAMNFRERMDEVITSLMQGRPHYQTLGCAHTPAARGTTAAYVVTPIGVFRMEPSPVS